MSDWKHFKCGACGREWQTRIWAWSILRGRNEAYCLCQQSRGPDGEIRGEALFCPETKKDL